MIVVLDYIREDRISGRLIYRRKFPKELVPFIPSASEGGVRELFKRSLHTKSMSAPGATERYAAARQEFDTIVAAAERAREASEKQASGNFDVLDAGDVASLAARYHAGELADDDARRRNPEAKRNAREAARIMRKVGFELPSVPEVAEWTLSIRAAHEAIRDAARSSRAIGDLDGIVEYWGATALALASEQGRVLKPLGASHVALCEALNDAEVKASEDALRRLDGDHVPTPEAPLLRKTSAAQSRPDGKQLGELFELYASTPGRHPKTMAQWRPYIAQLAKFVGHKLVDAITHDDLVAWRNHLRDEVTYRGKSLSGKTINGSYLGAVQALFAWAKGDGLVANNPALEVTKVKLPVEPKTRGKAFTKDEASAILRASLQVPRSREGEDLRNAKRWCPWLMAYSGARVNEITQLRKKDIFERDGVWVMRITPEAGTVKSKVYRFVPLHSHLQDQGFLEFVQGRSEGPLFFNPAKRRSDNAINRQANRLGSKLADWVRSLGIEGVKPNHAWRHLSINLAVRYQMEPRVAKAITGHASSDVQDKVYLADLVDHVDVLSRELEKLPRFLEVGERQAEAA